VGSSVESWRCWWRGAGDGISVGRTYRDAPEVDGLVIIQGEWPTNRMLPVRITGAMEYDLLGEVVADIGD